MHGTTIEKIYCSISSNEDRVRVWQVRSVLFFVLNLLQILPILSPVSVSYRCDNLNSIPSLKTNFTQQK